MLRHGTTVFDVFFEDRSRNHVHQSLDQFKKEASGPRTTLEATRQKAGCTTNDDVAVSVADLEASR